MFFKELYTMDFKAPYSLVKMSKSAAEDLLIAEGLIF